MSALAPDSGEGETQCKCGHPRSSHGRFSTGCGVAVHGIHCLCNEYRPASPPSSVDAGGGTDRQTLADVIGAMEGDESCEVSLGDARAALDRMTARLAALEGAARSLIDTWFSEEDEKLAPEVAALAAALRAPACHDEGRR